MRFNINDYYTVRFHDQEDIVVKITSIIGKYSAKCIIVVGNDLHIKGTYKNFYFCSNYGEYLITDKYLIHKYNKELIFG